MGGVAKRHASAVACPVVMKDLYLVGDRERQLLKGVGPNVSPVYEFGDEFDLVAASRAEMETLSVDGVLHRGKVTVKLAFLNDFWDKDRGDDRNVFLDRLTVRHGGEVAYVLEMEDHPHRSDCHQVDQDALHLWGSDSHCILSVPVEIPRDGTYRIDVGAWGEQAGSELPRLAVTVESDTERSAGSAAIREAVAELQEKLLGYDAAAPDEVAATYDLFVEIWRGVRDSGLVVFDARCDWQADQYYLDGIVDEAWVDPAADEEWDWDRHGFAQARIDPFLESVDWSDPQGVARTWVAVLAYLLTDYRYLYL